MGREESSTGSNLPAPYRNPWAQLAGDLRAALADVRLRLQELVRRNGEGDLWRPAWWPRDLAPLFWPLLSALVVVAVAGGVLAVRALPARQPDLEALAPPPPPAPASPVTSETSRAAELSPSAALPPPEDTAPAGPPTGPAPSDAPPDPLAAGLAAGQAEGLIEQVLRDAAHGSVVLRLTPAFSKLTPADRLQQAERWQQQLRDQGYEHLELRDRRAGLLGREALVGDGMILFSSPPPD